MEDGSSAPCPLIPCPVGFEVLGFGTEVQVVCGDFPFPKYISISQWHGMGLTKLNADDPFHNILAGGIGVIRCRSCLIGPKSPQVSIGAMRLGFFLAEGQACRGVHPSPLE